MSKERLIGGYNVLAMAQSGRDDLTRDAIASADELDHHIDLRQCRHRNGIRVPGHGIEINGARAIPIPSRYGDELKLAPGVALEESPVASQQRDDASSDRSETGDRDFQCWLHDRLGSAPGLFMARQVATDSVVWQRLVARAHTAQFSR